MSFDGNILSDEEDNSWEDEMSESEEGQDDYYDEEDEEIEVVVQQNQVNKEVTVANDSTFKPFEAKVEEPEVVYLDEGSRPVMNVYCTDYEVIKKVARKSLGYKLR